MAVTRNDVDEVYGADGKISSTPVVRDITVDANGETLRQQALAALAANRAFITTQKPATAAAQASAAYDSAVVARRQLNGVIRLLLGQLDAAD